MAHKNWCMREYTQPEQFYNKAEDYFVACQIETSNNFEKGIKIIKVPSIAGLCLHLGISRQTFYKYKNLPEYKNIKDVLHQALLKLEDFYISLGFSGSRFAEFMLRTTFRNDYQAEQTDDEVNPLEIIINQPKKIENIGEPDSGTTVEI